MLTEQQRDAAQAQLVFLEVWPSDKIVTDEWILAALSALVDVLRPPTAYERERIVRERTKWMRATDADCAEHIDEEVAMCVRALARATLDQAALPALESAPC